jgi:hypothetical protein
MEVMDQDEREELIEMLVDNSLSERVVQRQQLTEDNGLGDQESESLSKLKYEYALRQLLDNYFDVHAMEVTARDLQQDIMGIVSDLHSERIGSDETESDHSDGGASEEFGPESTEPDDFFPVNETIDADGLVATFEAKINAIKEDVGRADPVTFRIWFPWHLRWEDAPESFQIYDLSLERADDTNWQDRLDELIRDPDADGAGHIQDELDEGGYDIWTTTVTAKSPHYAFIEFKNGLQVLSAEINHARYHLNFSPLAAREDSLPHLTDVDERWTAIQLPFAMFWEDDRTEETMAPDRGYQGCNVYRHGGLPEVELSYPAVQERLGTHRRFDSEGAVEDILLHNALVEYQKGLTASDYTRSFFNFWRVLEELTVVGRAQKSEVVERALFAMTAVTDGEYDPIIDRVAREVWEVRNDWVHDSGWHHVAEDHERVAKVLADAVIDLHISEFGGVSERDIGRVLKWGAEDETKRSELENVLGKVSELAPD